jgi:beta-glucosidase
MIRATFRFPRGFLWGTATSSHQVEGDNRGNDWWGWEQQAGRILQADRSGRPVAGGAAGGLRTWIGRGRWAEHPPPLEWSRIEPEAGVWDEEALQNYRTILRGALDRGYSR